MSDVLKPEKQEQIRALGRLGWSLRRIEEATKVRRETISRHLKAAGIALRAPRARMAPGEPNAASHPIPELERCRAAGWSPMASSCEPYREWIEVELGRGRRAKTIWQDLVDDHGIPAGKGRARQVR
jgi:hypothetical protein